MTGLVLVSHSRELARVAMKFAEKVCEVNVPMAYAGGVQGGFSELGTDATDILEAIEKVYSKDGVVVLMDMGSAMLSAEVALELLEEEKAKNIKLSSAPLVEGAISAAVQISINAPLSKIVSEAANSLHSKRTHIQDFYRTDSVHETDISETAMMDAVDRLFTIANEHGLHARPAAKFVKEAAKYKATVNVTNTTRNKGPVSARSLNKIATLGIRKNDEIRVSASGEEAKELLDAIGNLIIDNFGEPSKRATLSKHSTLEIKKECLDSTAHTIGVSDGYAIGRVFIKKAPDICVEKQTIDDGEAEIKRLNKALKSVEKGIDEKMKFLRGRLSNREIEIFDAHKLILNDPDIVGAVVAAIKGKAFTAPYAYQKVSQSIIEDYLAIEDEYLQNRAIDVRDIMNQVLEKLLGIEHASALKIDESSILFAKELAPSETASYDLQHLKGIVTELGGTNSHTAILAKSLGIPAVCGYRELDTLRNGQSVIINGFSGEVVIDPDRETIEKYTKKRDTLDQQRISLVQSAQLPVTTADKVSIDVYANIGNIYEAKKALDEGADGVGLLRTEFMFLGKNSVPTEEEQYKLLCEIGEIFADKSVTIRTLDIGGDKKIDYVPMDFEENPFLGVRGIRLYDKHEQIFASQVRAILRAARKGSFKIMLPMVTRIEELLGCRTLIQRIHTELKRENIKHRWPLEIGIMIETPSSVLLAAELAKETDFFSIGTNDLTQYIMASERGNAALHELANPLHPSVLRALKMVLAAAEAARVPLSICGELGGTIRAIPLLIGMGVKKLSMISSRIPAAKNLIQTLKRSEESQFVGSVLQSSTVGEVEEEISRRCGRIHLSASVTD